MDIFLTGGTGALGSRVVPLLVRAGHGVTATARSDEAATALAAAGARPIRCDLFDGVAVRQAVGGHEAVVHLATAIPTGAAALRARSWTMTGRLRREAAGNLVDAAIDTGARRYVQEALAFVYADGGADWLDEDAPLDPHPVQAPVREAEAQVRRFTEQGGIGVTLRFGLFYGAGSAHTVTELAAARRGIAARPGAPDGYLAVVHLDDAATAVPMGLQAPAGVYNIVDDEPLTRRQHAAALAAALEVDTVRCLPTALGRIGAFTAVSRSQRVSNTRARAAGWAPAHRSAWQGWRQIVAEEVDVDA